MSKKKNLKKKKETKKKQKTEKKKPSASSRLQNWVPLFPWHDESVLKIQASDGWCLECCPFIYFFVVGWLKV